MLKEIIFCFEIVIFVNSVSSKSWLVCTERKLITCKMDHISSPSQYRHSLKCAWGCYIVLQCLLYETCLFVAI